MSRWRGWSRPDFELEGPSAAAAMDARAADEAAETWDERRRQPDAQKW